MKRIKQLSEDTAKRYAKRHGYILRKMPTSSFVKITCSDETVATAASFYYAWIYMLERDSKKKK